KLGGPMRHILITMPATDIIVGFDHDPELSMPLTDYCETYAAPADILDGLAYNGEYGWLANGFISLPSDLDIWIELLEQTEGLATYEANTFAPIFTTDGSDARWRWSGAMTHNWYTAREPGAFEATYRVYVGDANGDPVEGYTSAIVTLDWFFNMDCVPGDLSCDGLVTLDDLADFVDAVLGVGAPTAHQMCAADVNVDGDINALDIQSFVDAM
ncbi:MAG: dockerin type I repeat-containing protein, partial [Phycisphaerales bacterium]|nr:dockerin type I repeat-containing protein [Phycisphaerales bacterium]